jgi:hypothetical protein
MEIGIIADLNSGVVDEIVRNKDESLLPSTNGDGETRVFGEIKEYRWTGQILDPGLGGREDMKWER